MTARILVATLRDLSYIAANLRPEDKAEVDCQFEEWTPAYLAMISLKHHAYVVEVNGNPEAAFGAQPMPHNKGLWVAWSWGTRRMWRAAPLITVFVRDQMIPAIINQGAWRCEARAMASHVSAHRWLKRMGAIERSFLPCWGRNGEGFILFDWTRTQYVLSKPVWRGGGDASDPASSTGCPATGHGCGETTRAA